MEERRKNWITKSDLKEVIEATLSSHMQSDHHQYVAMQLAKEKRKQEMWDKVRTHVAGWGAVAVIVFVFASTWESIVSKIKGL